MTETDRCIVFWENRVFVYAFWRQTDGQMDEQIDRPNALSRLWLKVEGELYSVAYT